MSIEELLDKSETTTEILKVIRNLEDDVNYTKLDAAEDLINLLKFKNYI